MDTSDKTTSFLIKNSLINVNLTNKKDKKQINQINNNLTKIALTLQLQQVTKNQKQRCFDLKWLI